MVKKKIGGYFMLVATVQRYNHLTDSSYYPKLLRNSYVRINGRCMQGYFDMLSMLNTGDNKGKILGIDSGYWCWVDNPYLAFHLQYDSQKYNKRLYVCIHDVDEDSVVLSDYDKWNLYLDERVDSLSDCLCTSDDLGRGKCIQGISWSLPVDSALCVCPLSYVVGYNFRNIKDLKNVCEMYDEKALLLLDKFSKEVSR